MTHLQIKAHLLTLESKVDKNGNLYYRLSLQGIPSCYYYAFNYNLPESTWNSLTTPHNWVNRQVLVTYQELPNKDGNGTFYKVKQIEIT
jgi:hypothetical protein